MTHGSREHIEETIGASTPQIRRWFDAHYEKVPPAVYASADLRNAGTKVAAIDTNAFPAGFNNLCPQNRHNAVEALRTYLSRHHPDAETILLLPEDHTRNPFYLQNVEYLSAILTDAGIAHAIGSADPEVVYGVQGTTTPEGHTLSYELVTERSGDLYVGTDLVDLVFSNNDFTTGLPGPLRGTSVPIVPDPELGWDHRSKAKHFRLYNHLASEVAGLMGLDPWHLTVRTTEVRDLDFKKRDGLDRLAGIVEEMLATIREESRRHGVDEEPRVFIKDDAGTYGMGITVATSPDDVMTLNSRARQKMDKGKYGHKVDSVIVQEAIPTTERVEGHPAEPVLYMIGGRPIGAFLRVHPEKGDTENLNQPGMRFLPVCRHRGCHDENQPETVDICVANAEQLCAEIASLALSYEATSAVKQARDAAAVPLPDRVRV
jgi:glutamate--cysteine ligase